MLIKVFKKTISFSQICLVIATLCFFGCATGGKLNQSSEKSGYSTVEDLKVRTQAPDITLLDIIYAGPASYTVFQLVDPLRLVLDIEGTAGSNLPELTRVNNGYVTDVRVKKNINGHANTRVVVRLAKALKYETAKKDNIITIRLMPETSAQSLEGESGMSSVSQDSVDVDEAVKEVSEPRIFFKPDSKSPNQTLGIDFAMLDHGKARLTVTTKDKAVYNLERKGLKKLLLTIEKTTVPQLLLKRLDSYQFEGAVDRVKPSYSSADNRLILAIFLRELVPYHIDQTDHDIHIDFGPTSVKPPEKKIIPLKLAEIQKKRARVAKIPLEKKTNTQKLSEAQKKSAQAQTPKEQAPVDIHSPTSWLGTGVYRGEPMTLDFVNADVTNILRLIGEISNLNIVWGPDVSGTVSMRLKSVPWDQALDLVLANNDLGMRCEGNVVWIMKKSEISKLNAEKKKVRKIEEELAPLKTEYLHIDFANAEKDIKPHIAPIMTKRGSISIDKRTNTIILTEVKSVIDRVKDMIKEFDTPLKQIMIEARIVDASTNFSRDLGIQWNNATSGWRKNTHETVDIPPTAIDLGEGGDRVYGGTFSTSSPDGWASNIALNFAKLTSSGMGAINLDASLALAESDGRAKVVSAPKVIASVGESAKISRGSTFYLAAAENVEPKEVVATLSLEVSPTDVSYNNYVILEVKVKDEQQTGENSKAGKDIDTKLMVKSGDTIVIGGIYTETMTNESSGIPWLRDIPLLGWLFKAQDNMEGKTELLIFLTPTVLPYSDRQV